MKQASATYVNMTLTNPATATQSGAMATIAFLISGTWAFGSDGAPIEVRAHSAGLEAIVKHRNGLNTLTNVGFEQILRKFIQHFLICALSGAYPSITYLSDFEEACTAPESNIPLQECPLYCPTENFKFLRHLIEIFLDSPSNIPENNEILGPRVTSLRTELESFPPPARIYAGISKDASNHSSPSVSANLIQALISALKHTDIGGTWGDMLGPLYWVALTGSACGQGKPMQTYAPLLDSTLGRAIDSRCTVVPVKRFADLHRKLTLRRDSA
ncbi:hypothetical protein V1527DRAFT_475625 [Lipomyces starkeyi]